MSAVAARVEPDELIALFAGVLDEEGEWITTPYPTGPLAVELCKHLQPRSESALRISIYGNTLPLDDIPTDVRECMTVGFARWVQLGRPGV